jgi:hypothetical protein
VLIYRVFPYLPAAVPGEPGHPLYLHYPQGQGRLDNPSNYDTWYFATTPEAAVGEVLGDHSVWGDDNFVFPQLPGARRVLGVFQIADDTKLLDLDDARAMLDRGLRPTQVIARNRAVTQGWALAVFGERDDTGGRCWDGIRWWSFQRPHWTVIGLWYSAEEHLRHELVDVEQLSIDHPAVRDAAHSLARILQPR